MRGAMGLASAAFLVLAAGTAGAAEIRYGDGKSDPMVAGREYPDKAHEKEGATITCEKSKDTLVLHRGAVVRFLGAEKDDKGNVNESFFLKAGGVDADLGFTNRLATPAFWAFPEKAGTRVRYYAETFDGTTAYARTREKSGLLRLAVFQVGPGQYAEVHLGDSQGVTLGSPRDPKTLKQDGEIDFVTDPHNEWRTDPAVEGRRASVRVLYPIASTGLLIDLYVPKATMGSIHPKKGDPGKTVVENRISSWKSTGIRIATSRGGMLLFPPEILGAGLTAEIDNQTGKIEMSFAKAEITSLKAAISLTSEFASLATSPLTKVPHK